MSIAYELLKLTSDIARDTGRKAEIVVTMPEDQLLAAARSIAESCFIADTIATGRAHVRSEAFWTDDPSNGFEYLGVKFEPRKAFSPQQWPDYEQSG